MVQLGKTAGTRWGRRSSCAPLLGGKTFSDLFCDSTSWTTSETKSGQDQTGQDPGEDVDWLCL